MLDFYVSFWDLYNDRGDPGGDINEVQSKLHSIADEYGLNVTRKGLVFRPIEARGAYKRPESVDRQPMWVPVFKKDFKIPADKLKDLSEEQKTALLEEGISHYTKRMVPVAVKAREPMPLSVLMSQNILERAIGKAMIYAFAKPRSRRVECPYKGGVYMLWHGLLNKGFAMKEVDKLCALVSRLYDNDAVANNILEDVNKAKDPNTLLRDWVTKLTDAEKQLGELLDFNPIYEHALDEAAALMDTTSDQIIREGFYRTNTGRLSMEKPEGEEGEEGDLQYYDHLSIEEYETEIAEKALDGLLESPSKFRSFENMELLFNPADLKRPMLGQTNIEWVDKFRIKITPKDSKNERVIEFLGYKEEIPRHLHPKVVKLNATTEVVLPSGFPLVEELDKLFNLTDSSHIWATKDGIILRDVTEKIPILEGGILKDKPFLFVDRAEKYIHEKYINPGDRKEWTRLYISYIPKVDIKIEKIVNSNQRFNSETKKTVKSPRIFGTYYTRVNRKTGKPEVAFRKDEKLTGKWPRLAEMKTDVHPSWHFQCSSCKAVSYRLEKYNNISDIAILAATPNETVVGWDSDARQPITALTKKNEFLNSEDALPDEWIKDKLKSEPCHSCGQTTMEFITPVWGDGSPRMTISRSDPYYNYVKPKVYFGNDEEERDIPKRYRKRLLHSTIVKFDKDEEVTCYAEQYGNTTLILPPDWLALHPTVEDIIDDVKASDGMYNRVELNKFLKRCERLPADQQKVARSFIWASHREALINSVRQSNYIKNLERGLEEITYSNFHEIAEVVNSALSSKNRTKYEQLYGRALLYALAEEFTDRAENSQLSEEFKVLNNLIFAADENQVILLKSKATDDSFTEEEQFLLKEALRNKSYILRSKAKEE